MATRIIAFCGLDCAACPAYVATQTNDQAALVEIAAKWSEAFNAPGMTAESIVCDGCQAESGRLCGYCATCQIRACAQERAVANCAHCTEYACDKLTAFFSHGEEAKANLDRIRQSLGK